MFFNRNCCGGRQMQQMMPQMEQPMMEQPVMEPTITKCVEKEFYHNVEHCCPIHTHVINKHIYTHTYTPQYTCDEENVVINNDCGSCSGIAGNMYNNF